MRTGRLFALLAFVAVPSLARADGITPEQAAFFEAKIRPVLAKSCYTCHSAKAKRLKAGLRVDGRQALLDGGDNGPALVPGHPEKSKLIEAVSYKNVDLQMPPRAKLSAAAIADLTAWVKMGAPWPDDKQTTGGTTRGAFDLAQRARAHWSWQPIRAHAVPAVNDTRWPLIDADRFLLAKLEAKGLRPARPADARTLIRRLSFDLIGLPPTPTEVEAFAADHARDPQAATAVAVDRLLASPHFGERWGRHWLDLVRYAETRGHEFDYPVPDAHQYRDYVIRALNADVPYDQFITEHLAGDLLATPRRHPKEGFNESILGTGFWFLGEQVHSPVDICQDRADRVDNMLDVMTKAFLGLTVSCARCHDHKFDAISTKDYYALAGFLESSSYRLVPFDTLEHNRAVASALWARRAQDHPAAEKALAEALRPAATEAAAYLLAARAVRGSVKADEVARQKKLDTARLTRWVKRVQTAAKDGADPLHAWAQAASVSEGQVPATLRRLAEQAATRAAAERLPKGAAIIIDYAAPGREGWITDGVAYGPGPMQAGAIRWGSTPRLHEQSAAVKDAAWDRLTFAPGTEREPGALGGMLRPGLTLRTPAFTVGPGVVYALVRGAGHVYAAVEGHTMIAGPLHGGLVRSFRTGAGLQWVAHDLTPYKGRRAHLQFAPAPGAEMVVALVVQSPTPPASPAPPARQLAAALTGAASLDDLARGYQRLYAGAVDRLAAGRLAQTPDAAEDARLLNGLLREVEAPAALAPLLAVQTKIAADFRKKSRLAPAILDGSGVDEVVFIRGSYKTPGPAVPRRFLEALAGPEPIATKRGSGRLALARQMTDPARNPYLARVMVNRVWHHLFGRGLVASVDNFGVLGEAPSHPALLDHLSDRFVKEGWSIKKLIRALVLSRAYQMASAPDAAAAKADPQNQLLYRANVRRLEGEAIRDAMLAVSGRLDRTPFGPPVPVYLTEFQQGRGRPGSGPLDGAGRRSVYLAVRRNFLPSLLLAFDTPIPFSTVGRRSVSNVPAQALILLNDPFVHQQAELWAKRVLAAKTSPQERVRGMYVSAFARPPEAGELQACLDYVQEQTRLTNETAAWAGLAHVLFNTKEFIYLP